MTTEAGDDLSERILFFGEGLVETQGVSRSGFFDPTGQSPSAGYFGLSGLSSAAQGHESVQLRYSSTAFGTDLGLNTSFPSEYNRVRMLETAGGHKMEFNDTPGGERITMRHQTGAGIEVQPDGTVVISSMNNQVTVVGGGQSIVVEGDGNLTYKGNLTLNVSGDFNVNCSGDFNVNAKNTTQKISGNSTTRIQGNQTEIVSNNASKTVAGSRTDLTLGNVSNISKGAYAVISEGSTSISSKGQVSVSSETKYTNSSPNTNISADNLSVFGAAGTIGGENIIMYNYNMHTTKTVWSETVNAPQLNFTRADGSVVHSHLVGDVTGKADNANQADYASTAGSAPTGSAGSPGSNQSAPGDAAIADDTTATALPTGALLTEYLQNSANGIKNVSIDLGNYLLDALRSLELNPRETRAHMRDPAFANDTEFVARSVARGSLSSAYAQPAPNRYGRISSPMVGPNRGRETIGTSNEPNIVQGFTQPVARVITAPEPALNPNVLPNIDNRTKLAKGVMLSRFLGGVDDGHKLNSSLSLGDKKQLARNYWLMSIYLKSITNKFEDVSLEVAEGYFDPDSAKASNITLTAGGMLDKRSKGQAVAFKVVGIDGKVNLSKTYEVALYWKNSMPFNRLVLDYDNMNVNNELNAYIIVEIPDIPKSYKARFNQTVETYFNDNKQGTGLIECLPDGNPVDHAASARTVDPESRRPVPANVASFDSVIDGTNGKLDPGTLVAVGDEILLTPSAASKYNKIRSDAQLEGITLKISEGYRTYVEQAILYNKNNGLYPGKSKHGLGTAIIFKNSGRGSPVYKWLEANASTYGLYNIPDEPESWSFSL